MTLFEHLGHLGHLTEVRLLPKDGSAVMSGFFDEQQTLVSIFAQLEQRGKVQIGLLPRPRALHARAPNAMRTNVQATLPSELELLTCLALSPPTYWDDEQINALIESFRAKDQPPPHVIQTNGKWLAIAAIRPVALRDDNRADVLTVLAQYAARYTSVYDGTTSTVDLLQWVDWPIDDHTPAPYLQNAVIERFIPKTIATGLPATVLARINDKPRSTLAKLFKGAGKIDLLEPDGTPFNPTPENYDRRFIDAVAAEWRSLSNDELAAALFARPDGFAKAQGRAYCLQQAHAARAANPAPDAHKHANDDPWAEGNDVPPETLGEKLKRLYFEEVSSAFQTRWLPRNGVPIKDKAQAIVEHLRAGGARFYFSVVTGVASFVYKGKQLIVDVSDPKYCAWFVTEITTFGARTPKGRELTEALASYISSHQEDECFFRVKKSEWGHFDHKTGVVYLCMDPDNAEIVRIAPAHEGKPDVQVVPNGYNKVILKCMEGRERKFVYHADNAEGWKLFRDHVHGGQALPPVHQLASTCFNLAALIPGHQARPIKHHKGGQGSGKSYAAYDLEQAFYGRRCARDFAKKEEFMSAIDGTGPWVTFDNCEAEARTQFRRTLRTFATGSGGTVRKLFTNSERVNYMPNGTPIITAIEGDAAIEDLERIFEYPFEKQRQSFSARLSETERAELLCENTNQITSAVFDMISLHVLPDVQNKLENALTFLRKLDHPKARNNDFLRWVVVMTDAFAGTLYAAPPQVAYADDGTPYNNGEPISADTPRDLFSLWLDKQSRGHKDADRDANAALEAIQAIRDAGSVRMSALGIGNNAYPRVVRVDIVQVTEHETGQWVIGPATVTELYRVVCRLWKDQGRKVPWSVARNLGDRLRAAAGASLKDAGWDFVRTGQKRDNNELYILQYNPTPDNVISLTG